MHKDLTPVITGEEAETLVGVIPLNLASGHERDLTRGEAIGYVTKGARPGYRVPRSLWWLLAGPEPDQGNRRTREGLSLWTATWPRPVTGATSSTTSHVGWCWDGISCEARRLPLPPRAGLLAAASSYAGNTRP